MIALTFGAEANSSFQISAIGGPISDACLSLRNGHGVQVAESCSIFSTAEFPYYVEEQDCFTIFYNEDGLDAIGPVSITITKTLGAFTGECSAVSEICDNNIDDDGDDLIDCDDPNCTPFNISVTPIFPLPPACDDGQIAINAGGQNLEYNITGGLGVYQSSNTFSNLPPGVYNVRVRNAVGGCFADFPGNPVVLLCGDPPCVAPDFGWINAPKSTCPGSPVTLCLENADFNFDYTLFQNGVPTGQNKSGNGDVICFDPIQIGSETSFGVTATLKTDDQCNFIGPLVTVGIGDLGMGYTTVPETGSNQDGRIDLCFTSGAPALEWDYYPQWGVTEPVSSIGCPDGASITGLRSEYYVVTLTDANGCTGRQVIRVGNTEKDRTGFPEKPLLTPNGDGKNDELFFGGLLEFPDENELFVYNRFGSLVYQAAPYKNDWDCTYRGATLPAGVYFYTLRVFGQETEVYTGFITIAL